MRHTLRLPPRFSPNMSQIITKCDILGVLGICSGCPLLVTVLSSFALQCDATYGTVPPLESHFLARTPHQQ